MPPWCTRCHTHAMRGKNAIVCSRHLEKSFLKNGRRLARRWCLTQLHTLQKYLQKHSCILKPYVVYVCSNVFATELHHVPPSLYNYRFVVALVGCKFGPAVSRSCRRWSLYPGTLQSRPCVVEKIVWHDAVFWKSTEEYGLSNFYRGKQALRSNWARGFQEVNWIESKSDLAKLAKSGWCWVLPAPMQHFSKAVSQLSWSLASCRIQAWYECVSKAFLLNCGFDNNVSLLRPVYTFCPCEATLPQESGRLHTRSNTQVESGTSPFLGNQCAGIKSNAQWKVGEYSHPLAIARSIETAFYPGKGAQHFTAPVTHD